MVLTLRIYRTNPKHVAHTIAIKMNKNGLLTFAFFALLGTLTSTLGFAVDAGSFHVIMLVKGVVQSFADLPSDENMLLILGKLFWILAFVSATVSLFLKEWLYKQLIASIEERPYTAVIGICDLEHNYIEDLERDKTVIYNFNNDRASQLSKDNGFAVKDTELSEIIKNIPVQNIETAIVNTGKDRDDINTAFNIIDKYINCIECTRKLRLIVRIENVELDRLFRTSAIFSSPEYKNSAIEIKTYSFFEECATQLFEEHFIDGDDKTYMDSDLPYSIAIVGDGELAKKIVYEAAKIAHLPNENDLNIYLISEEPQRTKDLIIKTFIGIEKIPTIHLHTKELNYNQAGFYTDDIWFIDNLTNIIVCFDDEDINLEVAASLQNKTFLREQDTKTKILFGVYNQGSITRTIDEDRKNFKNFIPFGNADKILTKENIFNDDTSLIAKFINYVYDGYLADGKIDLYKKLTQDIDEIHKEWFKLKYTDQLSSLAQAKHIKMKLKALGLQMSKSTLSKENVLQKNVKLLHSKLDIDYVGSHPFPDNFTDTFFDKMTRMEHNRWNAYHYLNGWKYEEYLNVKPLKDDKKSIKLHNCLMPLEDFPSKTFVEDPKMRDAELTKLIEWDIYAFVFIPNYLAENNYILEEWKNTNV